jgi:flagellar basal-body rod protein FlgC
MIASTIALSGLNASVARLNVSASNVANINSTGGTAKAVEAAKSSSAPPPNTAYQPIALYQAALDKGGVSTRVVPTPGKMSLYIPSSPNADTDGMVAVPDVDPASEAVEQTKALDAYRTNMAVIRAADQMDRTLLDINA